MSRRRPSEGQRRLSLSYPEKPLVEPNAIDKIVNLNRDRLRKFLATVFVGNTFDLSTEEVRRCIALSEKNIVAMTEQELALEVFQLGISTRRRVGIPESAKFALLGYRRLHALFQRQN